MISIYIVNYVRNTITLKITKNTTKIFYDDVITNFVESFKPFYNPIMI